MVLNGVMAPGCCFGVFLLAGFEWAQGSQVLFWIGLAWF
jgi:hypothetical protein